MDKELQLLLPLIKEHKTVNINDTEFHIGTIEGKSIVALKCGIGKVNSAISTLTLIENFHVALVINTGVAGGTGNEARVLDIVLGERIAYHDVWCGPGTKEGQASECPQFFECAFNLDDLNKKLNIKKGLIASGDIFVSRPEDIKRILKLYPDAIAVDMESAAIAQVCYKKNVPFIVIRVVSDTPGESDNVAQYENFWEDVPLSTFSVLNKLLDVIKI